MSECQKEAVYVFGTSLKDENQDCSPVSRRYFNAVLGAVFGGGKRRGYSFCVKCLEVSDKSCNFAVDMCKGIMNCIANNRSSRLL